MNTRDKENNKEIRISEPSLQFGKTLGLRSPGLPISKSGAAGQSRNLGAAVTRQPPSARTKPD